MSKRVDRGIVGITDEGQPIVTANYQCPYFVEQSARLIGTRECWYCRFADFRKTYDLTLRQSICRCPQNRVRVMADGKNERTQPIGLGNQFMSNIKGGIITCLFDSATQSSKVAYINEGWTAITGYTLEELTLEKDGNPQALVYPEDKVAMDFEYNEQIQRGQEYTLIYRVIRRDGAVIWVIDRGVVSIQPTGDIQNQSVITEITALKEQEERLQRLAQTDQLTGLNNKATFIQRTQHLLSLQYDKLHALMIVDIDGFKQMNEQHGHAYGDRALEAVAGSLCQLFRTDDLLGRIGGDEFMVLMANIPDRESAGRKAEEILAATGDIRIDETPESALTVSVGLALSTDGKNYEEIFHKADTALYEAKSRGRNQAFFFTESLTAAAGGNDASKTRRISLVSKD